MKVLGKEQLKKAIEGLRKNAVKTDKGWLKNGDILFTDTAILLNEDVIKLIKKNKYTAIDISILVAPFNKKPLLSISEEEETVETDVKF